MSFFLLLIIILLVFIALLFVEVLRVHFVLDTDNSDMKMTVLWFYPLIKVIVTMENNNPELAFYLFNKHLFNKTIKKSKGKSSKMELLKIISPKDVRINTSYGFKDSFTTGITCGAINIVSQFINIESIKHNPDFITVSDYIYLDATAKVNLGTAIINLLKQKRRRNLLWTRPQT